MENKRDKKNNQNNKNKINKSSYSRSYKKTEKKRNNNSMKSKNTNKKKGEQKNRMINNKDKNSKKEMTPYYNEYLDTIYNYAYCKWNKKRLEKENKSKDSDNEEIKSEIIKNNNSMKTYDKNYRIMFNNLIEAEGAEFDANVRSYTKAIIDALDKNKDLKDEITSILTFHMSLTTFKKCSDENVYSLLRDLNQKFNLDNCYELSLNPQNAIYGIKVEKRNGAISKNPPAENERIKTFLNLMLENNDNKNLKKWILEILEFYPDKIVEDYKDEYIDDREDLREWLYDQILKNKNEYRNVFFEAIAERRFLKSIFEAKALKPNLEEQINTLKEKCNKLETEKEEEFNNHENQRLRQLDCINKIKGERDNLQSKLSDFKEIKDELIKCKHKLDTQKNMNESLQLGHDEQIKQIKTTLSDTQEAYNREMDRSTELMNENEAMKMSLESLESDCELYKSDLTNLNEQLSENKENSQKKILQEIASAINDRVFYLTMFYEELRETGKLEGMSIEMYGSTLDEIYKELCKLGIEKLGELESETSYDSSIHTSSGENISNGELVVVKGFGWKINNEIYIKIPVERKN